MSDKKPSEPGFGPVGPQLAGLAVMKQLLQDLVAELGTINAALTRLVELQAVQAEVAKHEALTRSQGGADRASLTEALNRLGEAQSATEPFEGLPNGRA